MGKILNIELPNWAWVLTGGVCLKAIDFSLSIVANVATPKVAGGFSALGQGWNEFRAYLIASKITDIEDVVSRPAIGVLRVLILMAIHLAGIATLAVGIAIQVSGGSPVLDMIEVPVWARPFFPLLVFSVISIPAFVGSRFVSQLRYSKFIVARLLKRAEAKGLDVQPHLDRLRSERDPEISVITDSM